MTKTPKEMAERVTHHLTDRSCRRMTPEEAFLAGYKKAQQWISVKERLPEINEDVLISYGKTPFYHLAFLTHNGDVKWFNGAHSNIEYRLDDVTHWMPLPEPPKDRE